MKVKYMFGKISFFIICGLLVSFSFVKEFGIEKALFPGGKVSTSVAEDSGTNPNESIVTLKFYDGSDKLIYSTRVDLKNDSRKRDEKLMNYLSSSELIRKDKHTLFFRINSF